MSTEKESRGATRLEALGSPRESARIFFSGHSLVDRPLPDFVAQVAESLGTSAQWNRQYIVGSSIERRTRGAERALASWRGYREGYNRDGEGLDVIAELRRPQTIAGPNYDVLLITEEHVMIDTLIRSDTIRHLRHYHDRFIDGNASGTTFFYHSWFSIDDKANPRRWIDYERAAEPIWQCMATRINASLELEGRGDRIVSLPAASALAELIDRAIAGPGLEGISRASVADTVGSIVADDVHLTPLGAYYMALVTYAAIYQRSPLDAWRPDGVTEAQARSLQTTAWDYVSGYYERYQPLPLGECRGRLLSDGGQDLLWSYIRDTYWRKEVGAMHGYVRYLRRLFTWRYYFTRDDERNPFHFDPADDARYWLPAP